MRRLDKKYKIRTLNILYCFLFITFLTSCLVITGCGEKENENLVSARLLIRDGNFSEAKNKLNLALKAESDNPEALCAIKALEIIQPGASTAAKQEAIGKIMSIVSGMEAEIKKLEKIDKDLLTDSNKSDLEKLNRKLNLSLRPVATILKSNTVWISDVGRPAIDLLIESLKVANPAIQSDVVGLLISIKDISFDPLIDALKNDSSQVRRKAVIALGKIGDERAVEPITGLLNDSDPGVRFYIPTSLEMIGGETIIEPLHKAMKNEIAQVRMDAATIIGKLEDQTGIDILIELLADDNSYVKTGATNALIKIGEPALPKLIDVLNTKAENISLPPTSFIGDKILDKYIKELAKRTALQVSAASILGSINATSAINPLLQSMKYEVGAGATEDEKANAASVRAGASAALAALGPAAVEPLIRILESSEDENAKVTAISILGSIGDKRAVMPLIEALKGKNKNIRAVAAEALGNLKDRRATPILIETLKDTDVVTKDNAALALGKMVDARATQALIEVLSDKSEREKVRDSSIGSLGAIKDKAALELLTKILIDEYEKEGTRKSAASALRTMENAWPSEALIALLKGDIVYGVFMPGKGVVSKWLKSEGDSKLLKGLPLVEVSIGQEKVEVITPDMGSLIKIYVKDGEEAEANALIGLVSFKDREIKQEERSSIRSAAATALGKVKGPNALPALTHSLRKDKSAAVRQSAAVSLREIDNANARAVLIRALKDKSGVVRSEAAYALGVGNIKGAESVPHLIERFKKDKYESARVRAAWSLGEITDKRAVDILIESIVKGRKGQAEASAVISAAITALDKIAGNAVAPVVAVLKNQEIDEVSRSRAAQILGLIESVDAVNPLIEALKDNSVVIRSKAAESLGLIADRRGVEPLINVLKDESEWVTVRANSATALGKIKDERAIVPLIEVLNSEAVNIKNNAVVSLGILKDKRATMPLIQILENEKEEDSIRANAISSLNGIVDSRAINSLMTSLRSINPTIRQNAVIALGGHGAGVAVGSLAGVLANQSEPNSLRASAADALGSIGDRSVSALLRARLDDKNEFNNVWISSANAAGKLKVEQISAWVAERAQDSWETVALRVAAFMALANTGNEEEYSIVMKMLDHGTKEIRSGAALALGQSGKKQAVEALINKLQSDGEEIVRRDSAKALSTIADSSSEQTLIKALKEDATDSVKIEAVIGLGNMKSSADIATLIEILQDTTRANSVRWTAASALGNMKGVSDIPNIVTALKSTLDTNIGGLHFEVALALQNLTGENYGYER